MAVRRIGASMRPGHFKPQQMRDVRTIQIAADVPGLALAVWMPRNGRYAVDLPFRCIRTMV